jgi:hypothetical protein
MHEQEKATLQLQLTTLQNERTAANAEFDSKIAAVKTKLGLAEESKPAKGAAAEFQKQRDAAPNPFEVKK